MTQPRPDPVLEEIRKLAAGQQAAQLSDADLLARFAARRDEAAFEALLLRHGPMVLRLCRRLLHHWHDAEDVFQATFLVLARRARAIRKRESLTAWLHGVAYRLAAKARARNRQTAASPLWPGEEPARDLADDLSWREVRAALDEELDRLSAKYRSALLLHYFEGRTQEEAARQLGCSLSTLKRRLERGRELLRGRLARRGVVPAAPLLVALLAEGQAPAGVPPTLRQGTVRAAIAYAGGGEAAGLISTPVRLLAGGLLQAMFQTKLKSVAALLLAVAILGAGAAWLMRPATASTSPEGVEAATPPEDRPPEVYALLRLERADSHLPGGAQPTQPQEDFALMRRTQATIIKSRATLGAALRQPAVAKLPLVRQQRDPVGWLEKVLRVDAPNNAELLRVGMNGYKPEEMAVVVNAVVDVFIEDFVKQDRERNLPRLKALQGLRHEYQEKAKERKAVLVNLARALGAADPNDPTASVRQQVMTQEILDCKRELRRLRLEEAALRVQIEWGRKEGRTAIKTPLEQQLAIRGEQQRILREEEEKLWARVTGRAAKSADREDLQQVQHEIGEIMQFLTNIDAQSERVRMELESSRSRITILQKAEATKPR